MTSNGGGRARGEKRGKKFEEEEEKDKKKGLGRVIELNRPIREMNIQIRTFVWGIIW